MYTVINVIKALSGLIETNFPEYPVNDRDIEEGLKTFLKHLGYRIR